jgi:hypothetical protein
MVKQRLLCHSFYKKKYAIHDEILKPYVSLGMQVIRIHGAAQLSQILWLPI